MFTPKYRITQMTAKNLMRIQKASTIVNLLPLPTSILDLLRKESREKTAILTTRIEGNTLDEESAYRALYQANSNSDEEQELFNLMKAIEYLDEAESRKLPITEDLIKKLHAIIRVTHGRRPRLSEYRTKQNQVGKRNVADFYLPPEASDVPTLMEDLVAWVNDSESVSIPSPITAGIFMWQLLTIHPYMDGNGRTARMLATYILKRNDLGLKGLFVLEDFYDRNLQEYYRHLQMNLHHNYYFGRNDADMTPWIDFFVEGLAVVYQEAERLVTEKSLTYTSVEPELMRDLDPQQRIVFTTLAFKYNWISTSDLRHLIDLSDRSIREKVKKWIQDGFVEPKDEDAIRVRSIVLTEQYQQLAAEMRKEPDRYKFLLL